MKRASVALHPGPAHLVFVLHGVLVGAEHAAQVAAAGIADSGLDVTGSRGNQEVWPAVFCGASPEPTFDMKRIFLTLLPLALAACASTTPPAQSGAQAAADNGTICERDSPTGSMLPKTRCTTAAEREAAQRSTQAVSEAVRNQRSAPPGKGS
ncbi:hypothetical protein [Roseateles sp. P5_E11]